MIAFTVTDMDMQPGERSARISGDPLSIDIAYQHDDGSDHWAIVVLIDCWDDVIASASRLVAPDLTDAQLNDLMREPVREAIGDAGRALGTARETLDRLAADFSS